MLLTCANPKCVNTFKRCPNEVRARNFCSATCRNTILFSRTGNSRWKGGTYIQAGYRFIRVGDNYIQEHRHVMSRVLGRSLLPEEKVHHINHNKLDNRPENLEIKDQSTHAREHAEELRHTTWGWAGLGHGCIGCGTLDKPHYAKSLCSACYQRKRFKFVRRSRPT